MSEHPSQDGGVSEVGQRQPKPESKEVIIDIIAQNALKLLTLNWAIVQLSVRS